MNKTFHNIYEIIKESPQINNDYKDSNAKTIQYFKENPNLSSAYKNAIRHIGTNMYFTQKYGPEKTKILGDLLELKTINDPDPRDKKADLYNNFIGRNISNNYDNPTPDKALQNAYKYILDGGNPVLRGGDKRAQEYRKESTTTDKIIRFLQ